MPYTTIRKLTSGVPVLLGVPSFVSFCPSNVTGVGWFEILHGSALPPLPVSDPDTTTSCGNSIGNGGGIVIPSLVTGLEPSFAAVGDSMPTSESSLVSVAALRGCSGMSGMFDGG